MSEPDLTCSMTKGQVRDLALGVVFVNHPYVSVALWIVPTQ
ncbi:MULTISPECIES: hypothetical protein [unclassified Streptomyces]|nr:MULTISPECIES: hypothetical protein [unclassified Streptomyces]SCG03992.1 hypothetical protein GA0115259_108673 [Streptomyces sp. MnatMP-M17]